MIQENAFALKDFLDSRLPKPLPDLDTPEGREKAAWGPLGRFRGIIRRPDGSNLFLPKPKKETS